MELILEKYTNMAKELYGNHLKKIILYGSYARGDYHNDSDVDIMLLVDLDENEIKRIGNALSDITYDINYDNDVMIMPIVQNVEFFNKWVRAYPFFNNVCNEGVELYAEQVG